MSGSRGGTKKNDVGEKRRNARKWKGKRKERGREGARVPESQSFHSGELDLPGNKIKRDFNLLIFGVVRLVWHKKPDTPMVDNEKSGPSWDLGNTHFETEKEKPTQEPVGGSLPHGHLEDGGAAGSQGHYHEVGIRAHCRRHPHCPTPSLNPIRSLGPTTTRPLSRPRIYRSARSMPPYAPPRPPTQHPGVGDEVLPHDTLPVGGRLPRHRGVRHHRSVPRRRRHPSAPSVRPVPNGPLHPNGPFLPNSSFHPWRGKSGDGATDSENVPMAVRIETCLHVGFGSFGTKNTPDWNRAYVNLCDRALGTCEFRDQRLTSHSKTNIRIFSAVL